MFNHGLVGFEFPLPNGFKNDSNRNDICASIYSDSLGLKIFIDQADPSKREEPSYPRFAAYKTNEDGEIEDSINDMVFQSEDFKALLGFVRQVL